MIVKLFAVAGVASWVVLYLIYRFIRNSEPRR